MYCQSQAAHEPQVAEKEILEYCQRLRRSDPCLTLPKIQREYHVPDYGIVLIVFAAASFWGFPPISGKRHEATILAVGFDPLRLIRIHRGFSHPTGFYLLLQKYGPYLGVSMKFYDIFRASISVEEVCRLRQSLATLPTAATEPNAGPAANDDLFDF